MEEKKTQNERKKNKNQNKNEIKSANVKKERRKQLYPWLMQSQMKGDLKHRRMVMKWQEHEIPNLKPGKLETIVSDTLIFHTKQQL